MAEVVDIHYANHIGSKPVAHAPALMSNDARKFTPGNPGICSSSMPMTVGRNRRPSVATFATQVVIVSFSNRGMKE